MTIGYQAGLGFDLLFLTFDLRYEGSITIDKKLMEAADILPYEQVNVLDVNNGARFTTYAIEGEPGSGVICLNGAAARLVTVGDIVIILTYTNVEERDTADYHPRLVYVNANNEIKIFKELLNFDIVNEI